MSHFSARRVLAGLAVAGAVLAAGAPATAARRAAAELKMIVADVSVPLGGPGTELRPIWYADQEVVLTEAKLTYQLSGVAGVSLADGDGVGSCTSESATKLVCADPFEMGVGPDGMTGYFTALLKAGATAEAGTAGTVTATFSAEGVAPITETAAVRVTGGVDLAAGPGVTLRKKPGSSFDVPLVVRNAGRTVADGAAVIFHRDYAFETTQQFSNCRYRSGQLTACTFDQQLQPGTGYRGAMPVKLRASTYAPGSDALELQWLTPGELEDHEALLIKNGVEGLGTAGSGGVLKLTGQSSAAARQGDVNPDNNWTTVEVQVTGKNGADLVAIGDTAAGAVGDVVTATVGVRNAGPATLDFNRSGESVARVKVSVPAGSTVVSAPERCHKQGASYFCDGGTLLIAGESETYDFELRIDQVVADAVGAVVVNEPCECSQFSKDLNPANNKAAIVLNGTGAGGGAGDGDGGQGGGLPVTGPVGAAVGGTGLALLVAGAAGVLIARRRRTRFVAP
jgi:hypothetical protein